MNVSHLSNIRIREFDPMDADYLVRIHRELRENFEEHDINKEFILNISRRADFRFFVAAINHEIVGFVGVLFHGGVGRGEIGPICVSLEYQKSGVGREMLQYAINFLRKKGIRRIIAKVKSGNRNGIDFFNRNGFRKEGHFVKYTKKGEDVIQMVRFI